MSLQVWSRSRAQIHPSTDRGFVLVGPLIPVIGDTGFPYSYFTGSGAGVIISPQNTVPNKRTDLKTPRAAPRREHIHRKQAGPLHTASQPQSPPFVADHLLKKIEKAAMRVEPKRVSLTAMRPETQRLRCFLASYPSQSSHPPWLFSIHLVSDAVRHLRTSPGYKSKFHAS